MRRSLSFALILFVIVCCNSSEVDTDDSGKDTVVTDKKTSTMDSVVGDEDGLEDEARKGLLNCIFDNPDTSLSGIELGNSETTKRILGMELDGDATHNFYSRNGKQLLSVTIHAGDGKSHISIFRISYPDKITPTSKLLNIDFKTEKGIKLGLTSKQITSKLGNCYSVSDSSGNSFVLNYRLESPRDSKTGLLERHNMPIYYAICKFRNDKLIDYEFGLEYP